MKIAEFAQEAAVSFSTSALPSARLMVTTVRPPGAANVI